MKIARFVAAAALFSAFPLAAQDAPQEEKLVCRTETPTGTHFRKRICRTAEEWRQMDTAPRGNGANPLLSESLRNHELPGTGTYSTGLGRQ